METATPFTQPLYVDGGIFALSIDGASTRYHGPLGAFLTTTASVELNLEMIHDIFEVRFDFGLKPKSRLVNA